MQTDLFGAETARDEPKYPGGFRYEPDLITPEQERSLLDTFRDLPFKEFEFHGFIGKRRTVSYGWRYDFAREKAERTTDIPDFLLLLTLIGTPLEFPDQCSAFPPSTRTPITMATRALGRRARTSSG